jgi:ubiquinone/menaquinone biosynthesis C-methylase UbiE
MIDIALRNAIREQKKNIEFCLWNVYEIPSDDSSFDVVIASQLLHLLDEPQIAAKELVRVSRNRVIVTICLLKEVKGSSKVLLWMYRKLGFSPKQNFSRAEFNRFLEALGFKDAKVCVVEGKMPLAVAVWEKVSVNIESELEP